MQLFTNKNQLTKNKTKTIHTNKANTIEASNMVLSEFPDL